MSYKTPHNELFRDHVPGRHKVTYRTTSSFLYRASEFNSCENTIQLVIAFVSKEIVRGWKVRGAWDK
jgi:hypothetical protein